SPRRSRRRRARESEAALTRGGIALLGWGCHSLPGCQRIPRPRSRHQRSPHPQAREYWAIKLLMIAHCTRLSPCKGDGPAYRSITSGRVASIAVPLLGGVHRGDGVRPVAFGVGVAGADTPVALVPALPYPEHGDALAVHIRAPVGSVGRLPGPGEVP